MGCSSRSDKNHQPEVCDYSIIFSNPNFKSAYMAWCKVIQKPEISINSFNESYQDIPEYRAMIDIGDPALDDLEKIMERRVGMYHMLYLAVIKIKGWDLSEFYTVGLSNQELTERVLKKLKTR